MLPGSNMRRCCWEATNSCLWIERPAPYSFLAFGPFLCSGLQFFERGGVHVGNIGHLGNVAAFLAAGIKSTGQGLDAMFTGRAVEDDRLRTIHWLAFSTRQNRNGLAGECKSDAASPTINQSDFNAYSLKCKIKEK